MIAALCVYAWFVVGCFVCASIDDDDKRLFRWASRTPFGLYFVVVLAWPLICFVFLTRGSGANDNAR